MNAQRCDVPREVIGIGGSLTAPPSHTTWHTGPYQGGSVWLHVVVSVQSEQTHLIKELIVERHAYARCMTDLPRPFGTPGGSVANFAQGRHEGAGCPRLCGA